MALDPVIVDISSDEEVDWDGCNDLQIDWISEYLRNDSEAVDASDDVVILDELSTPQKQNSLPVKSKQAFPAGKVDEADEDCLVLDGDPDALPPKMNAAQGGSDDLLIVGEKGEVACRDFAHPRHDCVKFPFRSTSHGRHCDLCHCYVCDIRAPCVYWGTGQLNTDHCHANNQEERWKALRRTFKHGATPAPPVVKNQATPLSMPTRVGSALPLAPCTSGSVYLESFPKTSSAIQTISNHSHSNRLGNTHGANVLPRCPDRSRPQQVLPRKLSISNERSRTGALGPRVVNQSQSFKRVASFSNALKSVGVYGSSNNNMSSVVGNGKVSKLQEVLAGWDAEMAMFSNTPQPDSNDSSANFSAYTTSTHLAYNPDFPQLNVNANSTSFVNVPIGTNTSGFSSDYIWPNSTPQNIQLSTGNAAVVNVLTSMTQADPPASTQTSSGMVDFDASSWTNFILDVPSEAQSAPMATSTGTVGAPPQQTTFSDYETSWSTLAHL